VVTAEELARTLELDVATTATAEEEEVVDVILGTAFPLTATSLAPQTFVFTRTSPIASFR